MPSEKVLEKAKQRLVEITEEWEAMVPRTGICWGDCLEESDGSSISGLYKHTGCHSFVSAAYYKPTYNLREDNFLALSCHSKKIAVCSHEATEAIIKWVAKESPFSEFILNRDDDESLAYGVILLCGPTALTDTQALWVCKVLRYSTESGKSLDVWLELVKGGVDPVVALSVCSHYRSVRGASFGYDGIYGHSTVFNRNNQEQNIKDLLDRNIKKNAINTYDVFKVSEGKGVYKPAETYAKFTSPTKVSDGWGGTVVKDQAGKEAFVANVLQWQNDLLAEAGVAV